MLLLSLTLFANFISGLIDFEKSIALLLSLWLICFAAALFFLKGKPSLSALLFVLCLFLSFVLRFSFSSSYFPPNHISKVRTRIKGFEGYVSSDVVLKRTKNKNILHQEYSLSITYVFLKNTKLKAAGDVLIKSPYIVNELMPGDNLQIKGFITKTSRMRKRGGFDYGLYLRRRGYTYFVWADKDEGVRLIDKPKNTIRRQSFLIRSYLENRVSEYVKDKQVFALIKALIFAKRGGLSKELESDFKKSGVYHVLALSGFIWGLFLPFSFFYFPLSA